MAEIPVTFAIEYSRLVQHLAQQKDGSRLRRTVGQLHDNVTGKMEKFTRVGSIDMSEVTSRHMDTDYGEDNYSIRAAIMRSFSKGVLVDEEDDIRTLIDPRAAQTRRLAYATGRRYDDSIVGALGGNATVVDENEDQTLQALPTAQKIVAASTGFTLAKVVAAKKILDSVDAPDDGRFLVYTAAQLADALAQTSFTSSDFNTIKALVQGEINTFAGFEFIRSQRLLASSGTRLCYAYHMDALGLAIGMEVRSRADVLPTKNYATGVHVKMSHGAVRVEDELVVEIACVEA